MSKEKLAEKLSLLIKDKDFVVKLAQTKSDEEAVKLFVDNDCELEAEKVKIVRDILNSLIEGEIEISEKDLENVSGGINIGYKKALAIALGVTALSIGAAGAGAAVHVIAKRPAGSQSQSPNPRSTVEEKIKSMVGDQVELKRMVVRHKPSLLAKGWAWFSSNQAEQNIYNQGVVDAARALLQAETQ